MTITCDSTRANPLPICLGNWAGGGQVTGFGTTVCNAYRHYPDIIGNMAPGLLFRQPDHFENYDDWPFLWGQNEGTIAGNTGYLIFGETFRNVQGQ